jgi:hypothetical protein
MPFAEHKIKRAATPYRHRETAPCTLFLRRGEVTAAGQSSGLFREMAIFAAISRRLPSDNSPDVLPTFSSSQ